MPTSENKRRDAKGKASTFAWLECFPGAACILDPQNRIAAMNAHARSLLGEEISQSGESTETRLLQQKPLLDAARRVRSAAPRVHDEAALIERGSDDLPLYAVLRPCPEHAEHVVVWFCDPRERRLPPMSHLQAWFGLSTAEAKIARMLCLGRTLGSTAEASGLSRHTPRNQLQRVFEKTGTSPQAALVGFLTGSLPAFAVERDGSS